MADVQCENGYTMVANELFEQMARVKLSPTQYRILFVVWRYTYGFKRKEHDLSLSFLSSATGCDKRQIQRELKGLEEKKIIHQKIQSGKFRKISFNKDYETWATVGETDNGDITIGEIDNGETVNTRVGETVNTGVGETVNQERKIKENIKESIPYKEIINFLNEKTGKNFSPKTKKTKDLISARWNEGKRLDDFKAVINHFSKKWMGITFKDGTPAEEYLRPSTLFNGKFDERVNEAVNDKPIRNVVQFDEKAKQKIELQKRLQIVADEMDISWTNKEKFAKLEKEFNQIKEELKRFG
jgi:phage replication O-like protein O